ncbi:MAG: hypothetical protein ACF8MF_06685 [Phycisphaerales bacterium JB052]
MSEKLTSKLKQALSTEDETCAQALDKLRDELVFQLTSQDTATILGLSMADVVSMEQVHDELIVEISARVKKGSIPFATLAIINEEREDGTRAAKTYLWNGQEVSLDELVETIKEFIHV